MHYVRILKRFAYIVLIFMPLSSLLSVNLEWNKLPNLPDKEGFAGSFCGVINNVLFVAGGANFPDKRPWEGGTKVWYDTIYSLRKGESTWRKEGKMPHLNGYGISLTTKEGIVFIGGGDSKSNFKELWLLNYSHGKLTFKQWPDLPLPLAQATGALDNRVIYVYGGATSPDSKQASNKLFTLNLDNLSAGWQSLESCPGYGRIFPTSSICSGSFYIFGGARLYSDSTGSLKREWLADAWCYKPNQGWIKLANLPYPSVAAPSPSYCINNQILILGGDDGSQVNTTPTMHKGFRREILIYNTANNTWSTHGSIPFSLVTTSSTLWGDDIVIAGGEQRPGVRSPEIWLGKTH